MKNEIENKFESIAIRYHEMRLYNYDNAIKIINECEARQVKILGIDSFILFPSGIQPFLEYSSDYSKIKTPLVWNIAKKDIEKFYHSMSLSA